MRFGWQHTDARIRALVPGCTVTRRLTREGVPFVTDENHFILDLDFTPKGIPAPEELTSALKVCPVCIGVGS